MEFRLIFFFYTMVVTNVCYKLLRKIFYEEQLVADVFYLHFKLVTKLKQDGFMHFLNKLLIIILNDYCISYIFCRIGVNYLEFAYLFYPFVQYSPGNIYLNYHKYFTVCKPSFDNLLIDYWFI